MIRCIDCQCYNVDNDRHLCSAGSSLVALHENDVASFHACRDGDPTPAMMGQYSRAYEAFIRSFEMDELKRSRIDTHESKDLYCNNRSKRLIEVAEE
jgi:hypothetical protein